MPELVLETPCLFHLRDVVFSHGWVHLAPTGWDEAAGTLTRLERLPDGSVVHLGLRAAAGGVLLRSDAPEDALPELAARARWILAMDADLAGFHQLCARHAALHRVAERGLGRVLRSPTVWEDLVKTLFSVNTTWRQTVAMNARLVARYGAPSADGDRAFPTPEALAAVAPETLQAECRMGYRAGPLARIARMAADGGLDLEALKDPGLPDEEVERRLRALPGIGPYAAANVLMLLGRHDHVPVDSWFRKTVRDGWFQGRNVPDGDLLAAFEPFRPYRTLVYRFYPWEQEG